MTIGLPARLRATSMNVSLSRAMNAIALVCVLSAMALIVAMQMTLRSDVIWPALFGLVPMCVLLFQFHVRPSVLFTVAYFVVGGVGTGWYAAILLSHVEAVATTNSFALEMAKVALIMAAGPARTVLGAIPWSVGGYVVAEVAVRIAATAVGSPPQADVGAFVVLAVVTIIRLSVYLFDRGAARAQTTLLAAAHDEDVAVLRSRMELQAAALLHDTVLNHLAAVAGAPEGALRAQMKATIGRDIEVLQSEEWLKRPSLVNAVEEKSGEPNEELAAVIDTARGWGLDIVLTGDPAQLAQLDAHRRLELALAVQQCLVNVFQHAGVDRAEIVVAATDTQLTVMVIDSGRGFDPEATSADRLGLRQSVRSRVEAVDGSVQVWSTPGRGTSIVLSVPVTAVPS